jgi:capsular exopolysaccharide synthesis family protein
MNNNENTPPETRPVPTRFAQSLYEPVPYGAPYGREAADLAGWSGALDPARVLRSLRKRWKLLSLTVLVVLLSAGFYLSKAPRIYEAGALVELSARRPRILNQQAAVIEDPSSQQQSEVTLNTQLEKFKSAAILPSVLACYRARNEADTRSTSELLQWLARGVEVKLVRRTRLVAITFRDTDPEKAAQACTAFAEGTEAHARAENRAASDAAVAWLETQVKAQRAELEKADQTLSEARQLHQMDALEAERKTIQQALLQFNEALVGVESQVAKEEELLRTLEASDMKPENAGRLPASLPRATEIQDALNRWMTAVTERDSLLSKYKPEHPEMLARDEAITLYRTQAQSALGRARATTSSNLDLYRRQAESLRRSKEGQSRRAAELERDILDRESKLASLQRGRNAADLSYQGVLNRIQEARLSADENTASVKLVEAARRPEKPVSPRPFLVIAFALMLGCMGGTVLVLVSDHADDYVEGTLDVEAGSGVRVIAVIPHVKSKSRREVATAGLAQRFSEVAEAFSGLRAVLDSAVYRDQSKVILVASSLPAEGKTTTCCNLASTCARNGQRTLLLDFDLRRPRIAGIHPMPPGARGLLDYLAAADPAPESYVYTTECPNLSIIASRPVTDVSPEELMSHARVEALLNWARSRFDRIILDGPPLGLVSEALVLAGLADCVLLVVRPAVSRKRAVRHSVHRLREIGVGAIAAVLNDVDTTSALYREYGPYHLYRQQARAYFADPGDEAKP